MFNKLDEIIYLKCLNSQLTRFNWHRSVTGGTACTPRHLASSEDEFPIKAADGR